MNAPRRLSELAPGLVIAGGRRTITAPEVSEFAARYGSAEEMGGKARSASRRKAGAQPASHWLICAIAEQLARAAVGTTCRSAGALSIERLSWPKCAHAGDDLELQIEVEALNDPLNRPVESSGFEKAVAELDTHPGELEGAALLAADIDHFKRIYDSHGHLVGDRVLLAVAQVCAREPKDRISRRA